MLLHSGLSLRGQPIEATGLEVGMPLVFASATSTVTAVAVTAAAGTGGGGGAGGGGGGFSVGATSLVSDLPLVEVGAADLASVLPFRDVEVGVH